MAGGIVFLSCNILYHNTNIALMAILSVIFFGSSLLFPLLGIKAGAFDYLVFDDNQITVLRLGKAQRIINREEVISIDKKNGYMASRFIQIDIAKKRKC